MKQILIIIAAASASPRLQLCSDLSSMRRSEFSVGAWNRGLGLATSHDSALGRSIIHRTRFPPFTRLLTSNSGCCRRLDHKTTPHNPPPPNVGVGDDSAISTSTYALSVSSATLLCNSFTAGDDRDTPEYNWRAKNDVRVQHA